MRDDKRYENLDDVVTIFIWRERNSSDVLRGFFGGNVGHAAIMLGDGYYISFWPGGEGNPFGLNTLEEDIIAEGHLPELYFVRGYQENEEDEKTKEEQEPKSSASSFIGSMFARREKPKKRKLDIEIMKRAFQEAIETNELEYSLTSSAQDTNPPTGYKNSQGDSYQGAREKKAGDINLTTNCSKIVWDLLVAGGFNRQAFEIKSDLPSVYKQYAESLQIRAKFLPTHRPHHHDPMCAFFGVTSVTPRDIQNLAKDLMKYEMDRAEQELNYPPFRLIRETLRKLYPENCELTREEIDSLQQQKKDVISKISSKFFG